MEVLDRVADALFPAEGNRVGNVKFFRGLRSTATAAERAEQLEIACEQIRSSQAQLVTDIDAE